MSTITDPAEQSEQWSRAEVGWLAHLQMALGPHHRITQDDDALLLSSLEPAVAHATVQFMARTPARIARVLDGIARPPEAGRHILLVLEDQDAYYRYVSRYDPDDGELAFSSGMHIDHGCSHFATYKAELQAIEPVIVHEMTHASLGHLDIPAWLNEGLAVNTERRLAPRPASVYTPRQLHWMHEHFWNEERIQEFWSGASFRRPDEGNLLSYELARILIEQVSRDWPAFAAFVLRARLADAGGAAAREMLGVELGTAVCALFGFEPSGAWSPDPGRWPSQPQRSASGSA